MKQIKLKGHIVLLCLALPFLIACAWSGLQIHKLSREREALKLDYSYVNSINSGLLSADVWRDDIVRILSVKIDSFSFSAQQQKILKEEINKILLSMIAEAEAKVNSEQTLGGKIRKVAVNSFVKWDQLKANVPEFSDLILNEIEKPETRQNIKLILNQKLDEYASQIYNPNYSLENLKVVYSKYQVTSTKDFNDKIGANINELQDRVFNLTYLIIGVLILFLLTWIVIYKLIGLRQTFFVISVVLGVIVLITALTTPMIEIDARISNLDFSLLGDHLIFNDQVLFLKSKSIVEVVEILLKTGKGDSVLVGILILVFSILFPLAKLAATEIFLLGNSSIKRNRVVRYLAFRSGKWSMADVMVVAIFMAYVGFKNILNDQLKNLNVEEDYLNSITTNHTSLQAGFILFIGFVIFSLVMSEVLRLITVQHDRKVWKKIPAYSN